MARTYYEILGVGRSSQDEELKTAYRALAKRWHPDVCRLPEAESRFKELQTAYAVLSDKRQRREYDKSLRSAGIADPEDILNDMMAIISPSTRRKKTKRKTEAPQPRRRRANVDLDAIPDGFGDDHEHLGGIV